MRVILAEHAGVCFGVERAFDLADEALLTAGEACSFGPLIHNPLVVADYESRGLAVVSDLDDIIAHPSRTVVIRSHGAGPRELAELKSAGVPLVDATCPFVLRAQRAASALGEKYDAVVIVGEAGHPEVEALREYVEGSGACALVADTPACLPDEMPDEVGVVVQTTQRQAVLSAMLDALAARGIAVELSDTICNATQERQDAALALAALVDAMVVVGGKHSSNTTRLAEICASACSRVYHIETPEELTSSMFAGCETVGLTAGASTPADQISAVSAALAEL